jgi:glycosyltransferase involved in cell wall biosynthesis
LRPLLAAAGHTLELHPFPRGWHGRFSLGRGLEEADAVILQRRLLSPLVLGLLRRRIRRLIFDFDDAVWLRDSYSPKGFDDPRRSRRFRAIVRAADINVAGNGFLAAEARRWCAANRVRVIPTCVDMERYPSPGPPPTRGGEEEGGWFSPPSLLGKGAGGLGLCLVWVGSSSTLKGLERFAPTLSAIGHAVPGTRLKIICDRFIDIPHLPVDRCTWNERTEAAEIASADVGIGWVPDDPWSRGKCGLKVLQYQVAGLPVVANPVGVQAEMVRDGETGLLATTTEDWITSVRRLAAEPALRQRLGAAARRQVVERYSVAAAARGWLQIIEQLTARRLAG